MFPFISVLGAACGSDKGERWGICSRRGSDVVLLTWIPVTNGKHRHQTRSKWEKRPKPNQIQTKVEPILISNTQMHVVCNFFSNSAKNARERDCRRLHNHAFSFEPVPCWVSCKYPPITSHTRLVSSGWSSRAGRPPSNIEWIPIGTLPSENGGCPAKN